MMKQSLKYFFLLLIAGSIFFTACKNDDDEKIEPDPIPEVIIPSTTKVLDAESLEQLDVIDTATYTIRFKKATDLLSSLSINDVLAAAISEDIPNGMLRKITMITPEGSALVFQTEQATLPEAITKGSISFENKSLKANEIRSNNLRKGVKLVTTKSTNGLGFDLNFDEDLYREGEDFVHVDGHLDVDLAFNFGMDWSVDLIAIPPTIDLTYFKTSISAEQSGSIFMESMANHTLNNEMSLGSLVFNPWMIYIGPVPVVFVPQIEFILSADGSISAELNTFLSESYNGEVGIKYNGSWQEIFVNEADFDYALPDLKANASFTAYAGPKASLKLYGIAGPYVIMSGYGNLEAEKIGDKYNIDLTAGLKGTAGAEISVLGIEVLNKSWPLFDISELVYHLENGSIEQSISFIKPTSGQAFAPGTPIDIQVNTTGGIAQKVDYYVDGVFWTSTSTPFEATLNTQDFVAGTHSLKAVATFDGSEASTTTSFEISNLQWQQIDLTSVIGSFRDINTVFFYNQNLGWCAGGDDGIQGPFILKTTDGGISWTEQQIPNLYYDSDFMDIKFISENEGFVVSGGKLLYTSDGGSNWEDIQVASNHQNYGIGISPGGRIFLHDFITFAYSDDYGTDWIGGEFPILPEQGDYWWYFPGGDAAPAQGVCLVNNNLGFVGGMANENESAHYFECNSSINSWSLKSFADTEKESVVCDFFFIDSQMGWAAGGLFGEWNGFVYQTTNGGDSWQKITSYNTPFIYAIQFTNETDGWAASGGWSQYGIYRTTDGGQTWQGAVETPFGGHIRDIMFVGNNFGVAVGDDGLMYRYANQ